MSKENLPKVGDRLIAEHVKGPWPSLSAVTVSKVTQAGRISVQEHGGRVFYSLSDYQGQRKGKLIGRRTGQTPTRLRWPEPEELDQFTTAAPPAFKVGQKVTVDHPLYGELYVKILDITQSAARPEETIVHFQHDGYKLAVFSKRVLSPKEEKPMSKSAPLPPTSEPKRRGRPAKPKAAPPEPATNPFVVGDQVTAKLADGQTHPCAVTATPSAEVVEIESPSGETFTRHVSEVEVFVVLRQPVMLAGQQYAVGQFVTINLERGLRKGVVVRALPKPNRYAVNFPEGSRTHQERVNREQLREWVESSSLEAGDYVGTRDVDNPRYGVVESVKEAFPLVGVRFNGAEQEESIAVGDLLLYGSKDVARACGLMKVSVHPDTVDISTDQPDDFLTDASSLTVQPPVQEIAQPVLEVATPEASRAQPVATIAQPVTGEEIIMVEPALAEDIPENIKNIQGELAGTPTLGTELASENPSRPVVADVKVGTLGVVEAPLHQLVKSPCNVRMHYDQTKVEEIAASIKADGQLQEAVGRWNKDGLLEIVAGETRHRAQVFREEQGEKSLTLRVNVKELTDAQALRISAQENMQRNNMTPLEECEAMLRMHEAGDSAEDIQATFGYKTLQPVHDRILVAKNLQEGPRTALDEGSLSLACAMVIARAPGKDLQQQMQTWAARGHSAKRLGELLTQGQFLVKHAKFDVEKSGLAVKRDLFEAFEPYVEDKKAALKAQLEWAGKQADKKRASSKKHPFVAVESGDSAYGTLSSSKKYDHCYTDNLCGLIYFVNTNTGEVTEETRYRMKAAASKSSEGAGEVKVREISDSAYAEAHERRAIAAREAVVGNTHLTLALTVWGLLVNSTAGMVNLQEVVGLPKEGEKMPLLLAAKAKVQEFVASAILPNSTSYSQHPILNGGKSLDREPLLRKLVESTDDVLLELLNALTCITAYHWGTYNNKHDATSEYVYLAHLTDAPQRLAASFKLTDDWLKRYPRPDLVALAEEAGLGRALVEDCGTLKEMRARILEHADALHKEGFVPKLVQFPALKA